MCLKNFERKPIKNGPKKSCGLNIVTNRSEPNTERCVEKKTEPKGSGHETVCQKRKGGELGGSYIDWKRERVSAKMLGPERGGL